MQVNGMPVTVAVGNVISEEGFSLLMSPAAAGSVWKTLLSQGAIPMGSKSWETLRVFQGFVLSHLAFVRCFLHMPAIRFECSPFLSLLLPPLI